MDVRIAIAAFELVQDGLTVAEVCRRLSISRDTYYRYRSRYRDEGLSGLMPRSTAPRTSPNKTTPQVARLICEKQDELIRAGWDAGARSIRYWLLSEHVPGLPSERTVHRVLVEAGRVTVSPAKRPRSSYRRFEYPDPNACWQLDGHEMVLPATGEMVCVLRVIDDFSRLSLASRACAVENAQDAWAVIATAIERHGPPAMFLTDGGSAFTSRRSGPFSGMSDVEARLRALHVNPVVASPHHPQTCGKKEREWRTWERWVQAQPQQPSTLEHLQRLLDTYDVLYNTRRPHQGIGGLTPAYRYGSRPKAKPSTRRPAAPLVVAERTADAAGRVALGQRYTYNLGRDWAGARITLVRDDLDVVLLDGMQILVRFTIDPARKPQRLLRPRGTSSRCQ
ncbi:DDE-type integrase/transposase/recombinase [Ornithinimicrobium cerasi]|uniref:Transposase n=1 Tax=Ornithinimicrobium cerasi TaxID=2248773 RepID=A0A285VNB5_9MICO|nr:DDE-type integrase/transposase/recombinase [Ornithinimicrobium cerasi]SOC55453.1 Transposase [Ornithinimicrobium cerasi]